MQVKLISMSTPCLPELHGSSAEEIVVYCARVSSSRKDKQENCAGLLKHCIEQKHWSIFETVNMCLEITTSRAISHQIVRHRSFAFQQFSQRYAASTKMEPVELRMQAEQNRQSSTKVVDPELESGNLEIHGKTASTAIRRHLERSTNLYDSLLRYGVAKETARFILPETTQTRLYMNGTMRSWIHYLEIRDDEHAQLEHQLIAREIKKIFIDLMPITSEALGWI